MFTKDVVGERSYRVSYVTSPYEVIPASGGEARTVRRGGQGREKKPSAAMARFERACRDALLEAKVDRAAELMARIAAARSRPIPDAEGAGPTPWELMAQYQPSTGEMVTRSAGAVDMAQLCAESEAAYAARNPHRREGAAT